MRHFIEKGEITKEWFKDLGKGEKEKLNKVWIDLNKKNKRTLEKLSFAWKKKEKEKKAGTEKGKENEKLER